MSAEEKHLYRSLMNTIDFFSQRLHNEQIVHYGFRIFEELTVPIRAAIYTLDEREGLFKPQHSIGYEAPLPTVEFREIYNEIARKNGFLLEHLEIQERYFENTFLDQQEVEVILPLIIGDHLYGFIIAKENNENKGIKDREFLNRFIDLLNLSLEKSEDFECTTRMKKEIDKRKFNLDTLAHTIKILMSTLDQKYIVKMCLDVVRELTASAVTSIALETRPDYLTLMGYKDILNHKEYLLNLELKGGAQPSKVIYHVRDDREAIAEIFNDPKVLEQLEAEYVVLLVKEKIIGCITIGQPVSGVAYDDQLLVQIKTLASMMYIAVTNSKQYMQLEAERNKISMQLDGLKHLNRSIGIINEADSLEELCSHVMDTFQYGFGVEEGFVWIQKDGLSCYKSVTDESAALSDQAIEYLKTVTEPVVEYTMPENHALTRQDANCLVCFPILQRDYMNTCLGYLVISQTGSPLTETQYTIFEALANSIAPVVKQNLIVEHYQSAYVKKPETQLKEIFEQYQREAEDYDIPCHIYAKRHRMPLFGMSEGSFDEGDSACVQLGNVRVIFSNEILEDDIYEPLQADSFEELRTILIERYA
ncbi:MAG: hypothetical protein JXO44_13900 [Clostridia bacterium]|nr:hypothetical protein [Clostridia bacterium]